MKSIKVNAFNLATAKDEAVKSNLFIGVQVDATTSWRKAGEPEYGTPEFSEFAEEYTRKNLRNPGIGAIVAIEKGQVNTRKRPYSVENVVNKAPRKMQTIYAILAKNELDQDVIVGRVVGNKADAIDFVKDYYKQGNMDETIRIEVMRQVVRDDSGSQPYAAIVHYAPSADENLGEYIVFGEII